MEELCVTIQILLITEVRPVTLIIGKGYVRWPNTLLGIKLKIKGKGYVYWTESHTRSTTVDGKTTTHTETESYTKNERYFKHEFHLFGSGLYITLFKCIPKAITHFFSNLKGQKTTLEPGERAFEFSFTLPSQIPSSFSDKYCEIIYSVKVKVDLPWAVDIKSKRHFFVRDYMALNELPSAMVRFTLYLKKWSVWD